MHNKPLPYSRWRHYKPTSWNDAKIACTNNPMNFSHILSLIRDAFLHQDAFIGQKKVIEFFDTTGKFQGDIYNFYIRELLEDGTPRYYVITSPFDLTWKWAPQQWLIFEWGKLIFSTDFSEAVNIRTGAMDSLFLQSLGIDSLKDKKILIVGSGWTAQYSYLFLRNTFTDIGTLHYTNRSGASVEFEKLWNLEYQALPNLNEYDMIFLHANVSEPYLKSEHRAMLKKWVIVTSYGGKTPERDIAPEFFTSQDQVVIDMSANIENLNPLKHALEKWYIQKDEIIDFWVQLSHRVYRHDAMQNTLFISGGTPLQNIAMMKYLMKN